MITGAAIVGGCAGASVPVPSSVQVRTEDYVPVPYMPRPAPVEIVPLRPATPKGLVWADGSWRWAGDRFRWEPGAWVAPPPGAKRARWVIVRRAEDGQLFFAPSSWRDGSGRPIDPPTPRAPASTRPRGPAGPGEITAPGGGGGRTDLDD